MQGKLFVVNSLFVTLLLVQLASCEIRFAFEIFRHGARMPDSHLDKNNNDVFGVRWEAPGELTPTGMRMHYLLGQRNRQRYSKFLSPSFQANEIYVKSTDYNRTIMSVQSQLQGLYPLGTGPELNERQQKIGVPPTNDHGYAKLQSKLKSAALPGRTQIFPIHLFNKDNPLNFFFHNPAVCPNILPVFGKNRETPRFKNFFENFEKNWGPQLRKALKVEDKPDYFKDYMNAFTMFDHFVADYTEGKEIKSLVDAGVDLAKFNETAYEFHFNDILYNWNGGEGDKTFAKISMSAILPDVLKWMDNRIAADIAGKSYNGYNTPKFVMFSTHDVTLGSAQNVIFTALDIKPFYYTPFASSLFFELYRPDGKDNTKLTAADYSVKIIFNDHDVKTVPYSEFKSKITPWLMSDAEITTFCGWTPKPTSFAFLKKNN